MSPDYERVLDYELGATIVVSFTTRGREVVDYAVVLTVGHDGGRSTVRVYDGAHGRNDMHRYTRSAGKQPAEVFDRGTLGDGFRAAIDAIERGYREMIDAWLAS